MSTIELVDDQKIILPNPGGQADFFYDFTSKYIALAGGWYAGKTWIGARKLLTLHQHNGWNDELDQPTFIHSQVVAQDYQQAETVVIPELQQAMNELGLSWRFVGDYKKYWFILNDYGTKEMPNKIYVRSAEAPEKINGYTCGAGWGDEVARWPTCPDNPKRDPLVQFRGRLRHKKAKYRQGIFTYTNEGDETQIYKDFVEKPKKGHSIYTAGTFENPDADAFVADLQDVLTEELKEQYIDGKAVSFKGGKIYGHYSELNENDNLKLDQNLPLDVSFDFNINPGMHGIIGQEIPYNDMLTAVYEIHGKRMDTLKAMAMLFAIIVQTGGWRFPMIRFFGDASGNSAWEGNGKSCWELVRGFMAENYPQIKYEILVKSKNPDIADRINAFNCCLHSIGNKIRYQHHSRCVRLKEDFKMLKWDGNEIAKANRKLSHASDAEGYRVDRIRPIRKRDFGKMESTYG